jgi:uracil-DNA glycosylase
VNRRVLNNEASLSAEPQGAQRFVPDAASLEDLRSAVQQCRGCDLYRHATQAVFSKGPTDAELVFVGEQPGDVEDRRGEPFVGPAGRLLSRAVSDIGLDPDRIYTTNAVKHFKFRPDQRGKRRIHQNPSRLEVVACRPWLTAEFAVLEPRVIVALGATAGQALVGPSFRVTRSRGQMLPWPASAEHPEQFPAADPPAVLVPTVHPSAILRADDRDAAYAAFVADLTVAAEALRGRDKLGGPEV